MEWKCHWFIDNSVVLAIGSQKPKAYHHGMHLHGTISGRFGRLEREEHEVLGHTQLRADEMGDNFVHPNPSSSCEAHPFMSQLREQP